MTERVFGPAMDVSLGRGLHVAHGVATLILLGLLVAINGIIVGLVCRWARRDSVPDERASAWELGARAISGPLRATVWVAGIYCALVPLMIGFNDDYFIEKPFQNWTRVSPDILGSVLFYVDYTIPVEALRQELRRIVERSPKWDRKVCGLQVTDAKERTVELRALVSAADAGRLWDLRCEVREQLLAFIQGKFPDSLPKVRTMVSEPSDGQAAVRAQAARPG